MTDQRPPEAGLEQKQPPGQERAEVARHLRHELRTALNHVVGYSELLLEGAGGLGERAPATLVSDLRRISAAGRALSRVVDRHFAGPRGGGGADPADPADLAQLCHDLRTPLTAVIGYGELLQEEAEERRLADLAADAERISGAGRRLLGVVDIALALAATGDAGDPPASPPRPAGSDPDAGGPVGGPAAPPGTVLVVDDDEPGRGMLARRLERLGHTVATAADGAAALAYLRAPGAGGAGEVDVVLLDVEMPGLDGYQVLAQMRADPALRRVPVVVLSAADERADAVRCLELGAEDYLPKPLDAVLLRARLGACLERKRLRDREVAHLATIEAQAAALAAWTRELEERVRAQVDELERVGRLRRFLSPQLADVIVSSGDERLLESHRREVTVLFCDLRGFTPFAETAEPEEVMAVLGDYHAALGRLIFAHGGTLERFAGDGLMVFFNDPLPQPDHAARAVRLALAIREQVAGLAAGWRKRGYDLDAGVGVAMGYATLGRIGFEGRSDYAAIGTVTNLAARLCGEAQAGQVLVSQKVHAEVEALAEAERLPDLTLKGFGRPVPAFSVLRLSEPPPRPARPPAGPPAGPGPARPGRRGAARPGPAAERPGRPRRRTARSPRGSGRTPAPPGSRPRPARA